MGWFACIAMAKWKQSANVWLLQIRVKSSYIRIERLRRTNDTVTHSYG